MSHSRSAELVNDLAAGRDVVVLLLGRHRIENGSAHLGDERAESLLHVANLIQLVIRPFPVEAQHGNSKSIDNVRIDLAIRVVVRNHLAASRESDRRAVVSAVIVLELFPITAAGRIPLNSSSETRAWLREPSP